MSPLVMAAAGGRPFFWGILRYPGFWRLAIVPSDRLPGSNPRLTPTDQCTHRAIQIDLCVGRATVEPASVKNDIPGVLRDGRLSQPSAANGATPLSVSPT